MKYMSIVLTTMLVGTSAFAAPSSNDNAKGRIHRVAMQIERESVNGVAIAKQVFKRTLFDRLTDEEVRAVAELAFVQDAAREFNAAVASENYADNPVLSRDAYMWLHRAFLVVEKDPFIGAQPELKSPTGPVSQMARSMAQLRKFYGLAERVGWGMAEVVLLAQELERDTANLYNLALRETDNRREVKILQLLEGFQNEAAGFSREAQLIRTPGSARVLLADNFRRLQARFNQLDRLVDNPQFVRYTRVVKTAYAEVEGDYRDVALAFTAAR